MEKILPTRTEVTDFEITLKFPSRGERTMLMNAKQIISENRMGHILLAIEDITEAKEKEKLLQESETKFRQLAEATPVNIWTATADGKRNYFNKYLLDYTGLGSDELENDGWQKYILPIDLEKTVKQWQRSVKEGNDFNIETRIRRYDGEYCWHKSHAVSQKDKNGKITGWVGVSIEIEEEKSREKAKNDFINIASHELKTPITTLKGYVQLMQNMFTSAHDEIFLQLTDKVNKQVEKLTNMINHLFDLSCMKEGKLRLNKNSFDIDELISEVGESIQAGSTTSHLIVKDLQAKRNIMADRQKVAQVLTNLISNAIKYSPQADKIVVTSAAAKGMVTVCVQDFGIGVSKEIQANIFNSYFRADHEIVKSNPGLGLGLYIAAEIVKLHEGTISVSSEINKGAAFCFSIPVEN